MPLTGASNLSRFARTAPSWEMQSRSWWNPASIEWKDKATTGTNSYRLLKSDTPNVLPSLTTGYKFTIGFWTRPTATSPMGLFDIADGNPNILFGLSIDATNRLKIRHGTSVGYLGANINLSTWNHIMWAMTDNSITLYLNGVPATQTLGSTPDMTLWNRVRFGRTHNDIFEGAMSDIWIAYDWVPNPTEAATLYNDGAAFGLGNNQVPPINPAYGYMTAVFDGSDTGTPTYLAAAKSSRGMPLFQNATLVWSGGLTDCPAFNPNLRPAAKSNTYSRLANLAYLWGRGDAIDSKTAIGTGLSLEVHAPALLPTPFAGWGVKTDASSIVGAIDYPRQTPQLTASGTLLEASVGSTPTLASGTLQGALERRECRRLRPTFARKV
jgi:hypothetical protein